MGNRPLRAAWALIVVLILGLSLAAVAGNCELPAKTLVHRQAPAFVRSDLNGRKVALAAYRGKVVLLNFWATWCAPCKVELPKFAEWQQSYQSQGFTVIAVSMDDDAAPVRATVKKMKLSFPVLMGDAKLGTKYGGVLGLPVTFLIDRQGRVAGEFKGETDLDTLQHEVEKLIAAR